MQNSKKTLKTDIKEIETKDEKNEKITITESKKMEQKKDCKQGKSLAV